MGTNIIKVEGVTKHFGATCALNNVSFTVEEGQLFGIIGPDGAGKTTLYRLLTTLYVPEKGRLEVCGYDTVTQMQPIRGMVGYMPGRFSLYQDLTVEENLDFFARIFGTTIARGYDSIKDIYSQIEPFKHRRAGALSGGMKQKLALSCALVHSPRLLFLDEPTTGVDPVSRKEFWQMIDLLRQRGITVVASTPYLDEIAHCNRVAFINAGNLQGIDTPQHILTRFASTFSPPPIKRESLHLPKVQPGAENVIEVSHLVKAFGNFKAVNDISFTVKKGEIFGFLGANGAGKTTAMHILTGLNQPTSGKATVAGFDAGSRHEEIKRHIGYMSQKFSLYEDLTVKENMRLFGGIYGMNDRQIKNKTQEVLEKLHFTQHANTLVADLPLGWKQKLAFSISIFHNPEVVFLDEPTGGVDPETRHQFWLLIYDAAARGITVFVTTHYMDEAEYCDRISIMVAGKIEALGSPAQLKQRFNMKTMDEVFTYLARGKRL